MAFEVPADLIRQVQISLRKEAGLSSYDSNDSTLPALPSLAQSIADLDPSPPYLRCKYCKGRLSRGLQSVICVYCGQRPSKEVPPDPIAFKSTLGYGWLLQSLGLDGSERVGPPVGENEPNRGNSLAKDEIALSDFLNLEISWPDEFEKPKTNVMNMVPVQSNSSSTSTTVDLDNFFLKKIGVTVSNTSEKQPEIKSQVGNIENNTFSVQENLSLFQNIQPSETAVNSYEDGNEPFSGWESDFQTATPGNQHEGSQSFDPFTGSSVDVSAHMDLVFGSGEDFKDGKPKNDSLPMSSVANDWIQGDLWSNSSPLVPDPVEQFDMTSKTTSDVTTDGLNNPSTSDDWFQADQWQTSSTNALDNKAINEHDQTFDAWNEFGSVTGMQDSSTNSLKQNSSSIAATGDQTSGINLLSSTDNFQEIDSGGPLPQDLFSGSFSNQIGIAEVKNVQLEVPSSNSVAENKIEDGVTIGQTAKSGDVSNSTAQPKDVDILLSHMHDLSFMLEGNLSVPSKSDGLSSFSQD